MTPGFDAGFAARCAALCPGFVAVPSKLRARKSQLIAGSVDGLPVVAKRLARPNAVWSWYLAREIAIYRAFAASPPPFRVPRFVAADAEILVVERLPGAPLASRRRPNATIDVGPYLALRDELASVSIAVDLPPSPAIRAQLRERLLEDPTDPTWVRDGLVRAARRGFVSEALAAAIAAALDDRVAFAHGDLLLRNALPDGLVDWECAGIYPRDWDLALLWTQLAPASRAALLAAAPHILPLAAFALVREIRFSRGADAEIRAQLDTLSSKVAAWTSTPSSARTTSR